MGHWKPIEIKPNDQSLVGKTVRVGNIIYSEEDESRDLVILCVGCKRVFIKNKFVHESNLEEYAFKINDNWLIYDPAPQREIVKMAPALLIPNDKNSTPYLTSGYFISREAVIEDFPSRSHLTIIWPAPQPDAEGFYSIEREVRGE